MPPKGHYNRTKRNRGRDSISPGRRGDSPEQYDRRQNSSDRRGDKLESPKGGRPSGGGHRDVERRDSGRGSVGGSSFNRPSGGGSSAVKLSRQETNHTPRGGGGRGGDRRSSYDSRQQHRPSGGLYRSRSRRNSRSRTFEKQRSSYQQHNSGNQSGGGNRNDRSVSYDSRSPSQHRRSSSQKKGSSSSDDESSSSERDEAMMYPNIEPNSFLQGKRYRVIKELGKGICARVVHAVEGATMEPDSVQGGSKGIERVFVGQRDVALKVFRATSTYSRAAFEEYSYLIDLMSRGRKIENGEGRGGGRGGGAVETTYCDLSIAEEKHFLAPMRFHFAPPSNPAAAAPTSNQQKPPSWDIPPELMGNKNKDKRKKYNKMMRARFEGQNSSSRNEALPTGITSAIITFPLCGPSLFAMLEQRRMVGFPLHAVRNILFQLFTCLDHCVSRGVMHSDVKPENILLTCRTKKMVRCDRTLVTSTSGGGGSGNHSASPGPMIEEPQHWGIVLADFGNALHPSTSPNGGEKDLTIQTRQYRAPEIILKCGYHSPATDVWSVGCIIPELLTGNCLWLAKDHMEQIALMEQVLSPISENTLKYLFSTSLQYPGKYSYGVAEQAAASNNSAPGGRHNIKVPLTEAHRYFLEDPSRKRGFQLRWPDRDTKTKDLTYVNGAETIESIVEKVVLGRSGSSSSSASTPTGASAGQLQHGGGGRYGGGVQQRQQPEPSAQAKATAKNLQDLIFRCLTYNPTKRITPAEALKHPFFTETSF